MKNSSIIVLIISLFISCVSCKKRTWVCYCESVKPKLQRSLAAQGYTKRQAIRDCKSYEKNTNVVGFTPDGCYILD